MSTVRPRKEGTLIPASKKLDAPAKRLLRIVTVCKTTEEFVELFGELADDSSIYIVTRHPMPMGTRRLIRIQLAGGETVMRADAEISESHTAADGPGLQNGMRVKLLTMDERTHAVHKKLLVRAAVMARQGLPPPIPADAGSRPKTVPPRSTAPFTAAAPLPGIAPLPAPVDPDRQIVPANPFAELAPSALEHFVECTLYEETAPHDLKEIEAQTQEQLKKEKAGTFGAAVDKTRGLRRLQRIPTALWSGVVAAVVGVSVGWLMRGSPPAPVAAPAAVHAEPSPDAAALAHTATKPAPTPAPPPSLRACMARIASLPSGAEVTWGDKSLGKTPTGEVVVPCGAAGVKIAQARHRPLELHVEATPDHPVQLLAPFGKFAAELELRSQPSGAVFTVDGASAGAAPTDAAVPIGRRVTVTATLAGHKPWSQKVLVKKRKQFVQVKLSPE